MLQIQKLEKTLAEVIRQYSVERKEMEKEHMKQIAALQAEKQACDCIYTYFHR
jgi:hypothetical protein